MKNKKVLLINQGRSENLGDKAINVALEKIFSDHSCIVTSTGFSQINFQDMNSPVTLGDSKSKSIRKLKKLLHPFIIWIIKYLFAIKKEFINLTKNQNYDLVLIGGGQLVKTRNVFPYVLLTWLYLFRKRTDSKIILFGIGTDDKFTFIESKIYKYVFKIIDNIYVRDNNSKKIIEEKFGRKCNYTPDVAFILPEYFTPEDSSVKNKIVIMIYDYDVLKHNFNTHHDLQSYYDDWISILINNYSPDNQVVLAYTTIGDKIETYNFANYLKKNTKISFEIAKTDTLKEFIDLLGESKLVISARMHALILSLNYKVDVYPYLISPKLTTFSEEWVISTRDSEETRKAIHSLVQEVIDSI